jgi:hypothetical protein
MSSRFFFFGISEGDDGNFLSFVSGKNNVKIPPKDAPAQ